MQEWIDEQAEVAEDSNFHQKVEEDLPDLDVELPGKEDTNDNPTIQVNGCRIIDIMHFFNSLKSLRHKPFDCGFLNFAIVKEKRMGLRSVFTLKCDLCGYIGTISTQEEQNVDINDAAVCGAIATGTGFSQMKEMFASMNLPMMSSHTFVSKEEALGSKIKENAVEDMLEAGRQEAELAKEAGDG